MATVVGHLPSSGALRSYGAAQMLAETSKASLICCSQEIVGLRQYFQGDGEAGGDGGQGGGGPSAL